MSAVLFDHLFMNMSALIADLFHQTFIGKLLQLHQQAGQGRNEQFLACLADFNHISSIYVRSLLQAFSAHHQVD